MPKCITCDKWFSARYKIDGITKILTKRKRCYICKPYKERPLCAKCGKQHHNKSCKPGYQYRRDLKKKALIDYKGGKCERCDYSKCKRALHFHHLDNNNKTFSISQFYFKSLDELKIEVDKCQLLCSNCHMELHEEAECQ